jgi:hypothetical protein
VVEKHEALAVVHLLVSIIASRDILNAASGGPAPLLQELSLEVSESGVIHSTSECVLGVNCGRIFDGETVSLETLTLKNMIVHHTSPSLSLSVTPGDLRNVLRSALRLWEVNLYTIFSQTSA